MSSHTTTDNAHAPHAEHEHPNYIKIWGILVALLVVSVCGPMLGIKIVTLITAFGIALVKAYLVAKNFMHLNVERPYIVFLMITMLGFLVLLFAGVAPDVMHHEGRNWENQAARAEVERALAAGGGAGHHGDKKGTEAVAVTPPPAGAAENFKSVCAACHGEKGDGNGAAAVALNPKPANFTDPTFWQTRDKAHIEKVIREGGPAVGKSPLMAPFGARFRAQEICQFDDYILVTFKK